MSLKAKDLLILEFTYNDPVNVQGGPFWERTVVTMLGIVNIKIYVRGKMCLTTYSSEESKGDCVYKEIENSVEELFLKAQLILLLQPAA